MHYFKENVERRGERSKIASIVAESRWHRIQRRPMARLLSMLKTNDITRHSDKGAVRSQ
jgi:hypothetical protein